MQRLIPLVLMLTAAVAPAGAQEVRPAFAKGTRVVVVAPITSQPRDAGVAVENKLQVGVGPERRDYTLHIKDAKLYGYHGGEINKSDLKDKMWLRAQGTVMDNPRRIKVEQLQVIGDAAGLRKSAFYRPGFDHGYVMAVAGTRETYPPTTGARFTPEPFTLVGRVSDDTGALETTRKLQVKSAGNEWTLHVTRDAQVLDAKGEKISVHDIQQGQWIRATGWQTDDLRMRVVKVENIGADEPFRQSALYRRDFPMGYIDRLTGVRQDGKLVVIRGTVTQVDPQGGYFVVKDEAGKEHGIYAELATIQDERGTVRFDALRSGEIVTVNVRHIQF